MVLYKTGLQIRAAFSFIIFFIRFNGLLCFSCYIIVYFFGDGGPLRKTVRNNVDTYNALAKS